MYKHMEKKDFEDMNAFLKDLTILSHVKQGVYEYWKARVNERIKMLTPLIEELKEKHITLLEVSPQLHEEWVDLHDVKLFYQF